MRAAIRGCPGQITDILDRYSSWTPQAGTRDFEQVLFIGMGGSAIGGDLVRVWMDQLAARPLVVLRGYSIPGWVGEHTLVLASSYSGNTEETLAATGQAADRGCRVVALTSGGRLATLAGSSGWDRLEVPGGMQPRAAIGYSVAATCAALVNLGLLPRSVLDDLAAGAELMSADGSLWADHEHQDNPNPAIAKQLLGVLPVIYGSTGTTETLALRLRGQLAENGKIFASHQLLPELNHNEIVGLNERLKDQSDPLLVWLVDREDHARVGLRRRLTSQLLGIGGRQAGEIMLEGRGETLIQRNLTLLHQVDWISYYAAILGGKDPSEIEILTRLKREMSQN
jgi:glucose/mannose-6-phosphate isomerase